MSLAPGTYVSVTAAVSSPNGAAPTGTWFATGVSAAGATGVAIPLNSMNDFLTYLGPRNSVSATLYDSLDEFFQDGGVAAYVSRIVGTSGVAASHVVQDGSSVSTLTFTATGPGTWGNALSVVIAAGSVSNTYTVQVLNGTTSVLISPNLFTPQDAVTWFNAQPVYSRCVTVVNDASVTAPPGNNPALGTYTLTSGVDDNAPGESFWTAGLTAFLAALGPGQVSAPGHTTTAGYLAVDTHAVANNRVALLDVADSASASSLITQATTFQGSAADPSYAAMLAPWVIIPGPTSTNPGSSSPVPTRTIPPSALAAALMSRNDQRNDANTPAAGNNGQSVYAVGVTQTYVASDLAALNAAGVCVNRQISGAVTLYGYRSLSVDPNWAFLNNVRFRMQVVNDFDAVGNNFVFDQIDGKGQLFANFNGALAGQCQKYYLDGSLYGATSNEAFSINTGPQVNTPATIAAQQINAQVGLKMSPMAEKVFVAVTKFAPNAPLPVV